MKCLTWRITLADVFDCSIEGDSSSLFCPGEVDAEGDKDASRHRVNPFPYTIETSTYLIDRVDTLVQDFALLTLDLLRFCVAAIMDRELLSARKEQFS